MAAGHLDQRSDFGNAVKVPAVKPYFWVVKLLTTAMGEAVSDYLVNDVNKYLAVVVGFVLFVVAINWQFRTPTYRTWPYWSAVAMVAVFGTMCADVMHIVIGLPYTVSATFYAVCLTVTFVTWYRSERTLDIHSIVTRRREVFYWLAVIFTFAMGTALGDLLAHPRFHMHFTPTSSSWLNQVERWFGLLTDKQIRRGVHKNVQALEKDIRNWIAHWNEDPKPFTWTKSADEIFERLAGYLNRLPNPKP